MSSKTVLVIAFDGLDRELIKEFGLSNVTQKEFGKIDNKTGMNQIITNELYASFLTGKTFEDHKIFGSVTYKNKISEVIFTKLLDNKTLSRLPGGFSIKDFLQSLPLLGEKKPTNEDYNTETLFDKISNSKDIFISGYSYYNAGLELNPFDINRKGVDREYAFSVYREKEHSYRKKKLFRPVNSYYDFTMAHFMLADVAQHFWGDESIGVNKENLRPIYEHLDELAGKIREEFRQDYDIIIFMSDHGLVTQEAHNENAFYSSNEALFESKTPKITDFHDKILHLVKNN